MKQIERSFIKSFILFFDPIINNKNLGIKASIPTILISFLSLAGIYIIKDIINNIENSSEHNIMFLILIFIILMLFSYIIIYFTRTFTHPTLWPEIKNYLNKKYLSEFIKLDNNSVERIGTGKLVSIINGGIHIWTDLLNVFFIDLLSSFVLLIFSLILVGTINILYSFILLISLVIILIINIYLQKRSISYRTKRTLNKVYIGRLVTKVIMSKYEILQNKTINSELNKVSKIFKENLGLNRKIINYTIIGDLLLKILIDISKIGIIIFFSFEYFGNNINFGELLSIMSILYIIEQILLKFTSIYINFSKNIIDVELIWNLFETTPNIKGYDKGKTFVHTKGDIDIKNLNYGYSKKIKIFDNFNLNIKGEEVTALVGLSGSGKSTLVKLIAGYIKYDSGDIIIDKQNLSEISLKSYYKDIGYLTQEPSVFDGTILENLTYAIKGEVEEKELNKIIKLAKCEFIFELPEGINTEIGEKGIRLSGGQRQRLAIAKIFLKNPKIIILDEPTSALDSFSEEMITKAMNNLFKGRTVIIIAHRLQTVKHANEIILLEGGKIVERGTHRELVKQKGIYNKMLELQSGF